MPFMRNRVTGTKDEIRTSQGYNRRPAIVQPWRSLSNLTPFRAHKRGDFDLNGLNNPLTPRLFKRLIGFFLPFSVNSFSPPTPQRVCSVLLL